MQLVDTDIKIAIINKHHYLTETMNVRSEEIKTIKNEQQNDIIKSRKVVHRVGNISKLYSLIWNIIFIIQKELYSSIVTKKDNLDKNEQRTSIDISKRRYIND